MRKPWLRTSIAIIALAMLGLLFRARDNLGIQSIRSIRDASVTSASPSSITSTQPLAEQPAIREQARHTSGGPSLALEGRRVGTATDGPSQSELDLSPSQPDADAPLDQGAVPVKCWGLRGSAPEDFMVGVDGQVRTTGRSSATITSLRDSPGVGTLYQFSAADSLRGKRVEFSVDLRTAGVNRASNVFFRADDATGKAVAFDNMWLNYDEVRTKELILNRGIKGNTGWSTQHVVLDIPREAVAVSYGVFLDGPGKVWIDNARIEVVSEEMLTTAPAPLPEHLAYSRPILVDRDTLSATPRNLGFESGAELPCK
jgi:hypothetical protein